MNYKIIKSNNNSNVNFDLETLNLVETLVFPVESISLLRKEEVKTLDIVFGDNILQKIIFNSAINDYNFFKNIISEISITNKNTKVIVGVNIKSYNIDTNNNISFQNCFLKTNSTIKQEFSFSKVVFTFINCSDEQLFKLDEKDGISFLFKSFIPFQNKANNFSED